MVTTRTDERNAAEFLASTAKVQKSKERELNPVLPLQFYYICMFFTKRSRFPKGGQKAEPRKKYKRQEQIKIARIDSHIARITATTKSENRMLWPRRPRTARAASHFRSRFRQQRRPGGKTQRRRFVFKIESCGFDAAVSQSEDSSLTQFLSARPVLLVFGGTLSLLHFATFPICSRFVHLSLRDTLYSMAVSGTGIFVASERCYAYQSEKERWWWRGGRGLYVSSVSSFLLYFHVSC